MGTEKKITAVSASVNDDHQLPIRRRLRKLSLCYITTWTISRKDLGLEDFKIQLVQKLKPHVLSKLWFFCEWTHRKLAEHPLFCRKVKFSDEAHFWINGYVNKQNCRFRSEDQPAQLQKLPMHPEKSQLMADSIIGPYFFKDTGNRNVTVNAERYREMMSKVFAQMQDGTRRCGEHFVSCSGPRIARLDRSI